MSKLVDVVREALRTKHYAYRTEKTYLHWIKQYVRFLKPIHPREAGADGVKRFLTHLAVDRGVSFGTQNQALCALLFLYKLYGIDLGQLNIVRARKSTWLPTVVTHDEALRVIEQLEGQYRIMAQLMYGGGLRLLEVLRLRVKDIDFDTRTLTLRETKSNRDRITCLPESAIPALTLHLAKIKAQHTIDLAEGRGEVELPFALDRKYPSAPFEWAWQYVFPANRFSKDPRSGHIRRHHVFETSVQRAIKQAAKKAGITKHVGPHTLRHSFGRSFGRLVNASKGCNLLTGTDFLTLATWNTKLLHAGQLPGERSELCGADHAPKGKRSERWERVSRSLAKMRRDQVVAGIGGL